LLVHLAMWVPAGAIGGLALGLGVGLGRDHARVVAWRGALGGLLGAVAAVFLYEVLGGLAFPAERTPQPFAESWMPRSLAVVLVCLFAAAGAAFAIVDAFRPRRPARVVSR
jgi:hypothetical protein